MTDTIFKPDWLLKNRHIQTLLNSIGPPRAKAIMLKKQLASVPTELKAMDGTRLLADYDTSSADSSALVVLLHGWEGSSRSIYQIHTTTHLLRLGFDVLRINFRDHGGSHHLNKGLFNSTRSPEVSSAIENFLANHHYDKVFLAGFSLGGNFALRIASDRGRALGITAVAAICPPVNPANAMKALNCGWPVYERYFFRKWTRSLEIKLRHFPELGYGKALAEARTVDDLNAFFVPEFTSYSTVESYFAAYALTDDRLSGLTVPGWLLASADDPIIPVDDLRDINPNSQLTMDSQSLGGHCGFAESIRGTNWAISRLGTFFLSHL